MKLEVGMYCRYKNFQNKVKIAKIKGIQKADEVFQYDYMSFDNGEGELETNIIKASFDVIDVLEVGDFLDNHCIIKIENDTCYLNDGWFINADDIENLITSICTKEQFEQMSYKLEE